MELWDLYTKDRQKTDKTMERGAKHPKGFYRLVVHIAIFNSRGEMLIQQRQADKFGWPNMWDISASGSVIAGETSSMAAERELGEELGLTLSFADRRPALTVHFPEGMGDVFLLEQDVDLSSLVLQKEEVQAVRWASEAEILRMIENDTFIPYQAHFIGLLFYLRNHATLHIKPDLTRE
jgi:isopentenyldiphosphate isomerase